MPAIERNQPTEAQRTETAANQFFDMAEKTNPYMESEKQKRETFENAGRETAQGNYDTAQRVLEGKTDWDNSIRGVASEINQLEQERVGSEPMSFDQAIDTISGYSESLQELGTSEDLKSALEVQKIAAGMVKSGKEGLEAVDEALQYIEGTLKTGTESQRFLKPEHRKELEEKRAIRDALYREKQKRAEQLKSSQQGEDELTKGRVATGRNLENMYAQANVPEYTPSRQEFLTKLTRMSEEELHFLDSELEKAMREFGRTRDSKLLDGRLANLSTESFKLQDVEARQKQVDKERITEIRDELGLEEEQENEPEQEPQETSPLQKFNENPDIFFDRYPDVDSGYSNKIGARAIMDAFTSLYPDPQERTKRLEEIIDTFDAIKEESAKNRPDIEEFGHGAFAKKQILKQLPNAERQEIEEIIKKEVNVKAGFGFKLGSDFVLGDFIDFLEDVKKSANR